MLRIRGVLSRNEGPRGMVIGLVLVALASALPVIVGSSAATTTQLDYVAIIVIMAIGLNVIFGFAGELAIGSGGLLAIGGYAAAIVANHYPQHVGLVVMCVIGAVAGGIFGLVLAIPSLRVSGFYLALVTLFVSELIPEVAQHLKITGGFDGISLVSNPDFMPRLTGRGLYAVIVAIVGLCVIVSWLLRKSLLGRQFVLLKRGEVVAQSLGVARYTTKVRAFVLSSLIGGLAGGVYTYAEQFFSPGSANTNTSIYVLAACVVGGVGTIWGPVVGGIIIGVLSEFVGRFNQYEGIAFGCLLIAVAVAAPGGVVDLWHDRGRLWSRVRREHQDVEAETDERIGAALLERLRSEAPGQDGSDRQDVSQEEDPANSLKIEGVVRRFGGVNAVSDLDLIVRPGSVHGLVGSNGSGKSTLLNLISGFYSLNAGTISIGEERLDGHRPDEIARRGIARSFQTPLIMMDETVFTNILVAAELGCGAGGMSSMFRTPKGRKGLRVAHERAEVALTLVGLDVVQDRKARELPHGTLRLVEMARALALRPKFVLLDEPAAGLSAAESEILRASIARIKAQGVGVLLVEHNVPLVRQLADEVTVMHFGQKLASGDPSILERDPRVAAIFMGAEAEMLAAE